MVFKVSYICKVMELYLFLRKGMDCFQKDENLQILFFFVPVDVKIYFSSYDTI